MLAFWTDHLGSISAVHELWDVPFADWTFQRCHFLFLVRPLLVIPYDVPGIVGRPPEGERPAEDVPDVGRRRSKAGSLAAVSRYL